MSIMSVSILLFMVMDPFGNVPFFVSALDGVAAERRRRVMIRELLVALAILSACLFVGPFFMKSMQVSEPSLRIAGGIILFLIAMKMVFGGADELFKDAPDGEPFVVPLAVPYLAGPSAIATLMVLVGQEPDRWPAWLTALFIAWAAAAVILLASTRLAKLLGKRALYAIERLMGLILTALSVEMVLVGIRTAG